MSLPLSLFFSNPILLPVCGVDPCQGTSLGTVVLHIYNLFTQKLSVEIKHLCGKMRSELAGNEERQHIHKADNKSFLCASRPVNLQLIECFVFKWAELTLVAH